MDTSYTLIPDSSVLSNSPLLQILLILGSGLLGVCIGSFLAARAIRTAKSLPQNLLGRSACLHCDRQLTTRDLIPILSYLLRRGKCAHCQKKIASTYLWIELATALLFMLSSVFLLMESGLFLSFGELYSPIPFSLVFVMATALYFATLSLFIYICSVDILIMAFPVRILGVFTLIHLVFGVLGIGEDVIPRLRGIIFFVAVLSAIQFIGGWIKKSKVMGEGDLWLGAVVGASLGMVGSIVAFYVSFIVGALIALGMMLVLGRKKVLGKKLPFGPFLCIGWLIAYFFSTPLFALLFPIS